MASKWVGCLAAAMLWCGGLPASADVTSTTRYADFLVKGSNPSEIYRAILRRGPHMAGGKAIATAAATATQDGRMRQQGSRCSVVDYRIKLSFRIVRPRIANERMLAPADRTQWRQFSRFVEDHENQHKQTWLACARRLDREVRAIKASSCDKVEARVNRLWDRMLSSCDKQQESFDNAQALELKNQPFMKRALRGGP